MSLVNLGLAEDRSSAFIAADSAIVDVPTARRFHASKLIPIPHVRSVLALRGPFLVLSLVAHNAFAIQGDGIEDVVENMPVLLEKADEMLRKHWAEHALPPEHLNEVCELFACGWGEHGAEGHLWQRSPGSEDFVHSEVPPGGLLIGPNDLTFEDLAPGIEEPRAMRRLARAQCELLRGAGRRDVGGGSCRRR